MLLASIFSILIDLSFAVALDVRYVIIQIGVGLISNTNGKY